MNSDFKAEFKNGIWPRLNLIAWCFVLFLSSIFTSKHAKEVAKGFVIYKREIMRQEANNRRFPHRQREGG